MSTEDDVFWLYERNKNYHADCVKIGKCDTCPEMCNGKCYCSYNEIVNPITIGFTDVKCDVKRKTYIKPGQECPVCFDPILKKSDAYLTACGHGFHKLCMFNVFHNTWKINKYADFKCPICRCLLGIPYIPEKYNTFSLEINGLDKLEDFWNYFDYQLCFYCDNKHIEGMNKDCILCTNYRKYGNCSKLLSTPAKLL